MRVCTALLAFTLAAPLPSAARAQEAAEEKAPGWANAAELTVIVTTGNAAANTLGFRNDLTRTWETAELNLDVGMLRAGSGQVSRHAVGASQSSFDVSKVVVSMRTVERYHARGQYQRALSERTFWYAASGWERNTFAGYKNRTSMSAGAGNTWLEAGRGTLHTTYGVAYTVQEGLVDVATRDDSFSGLRFAFDYRLQVTPSTLLTSELIADQSLEQAADFRSDLLNAVTVSMTDRLALKVSWQVLYDREPALIEVGLTTRAGPRDTVFVPLEPLDHLLNFSVVATF